MIDEAIQIFDDACMPIGKWVTKCPILRSHLASQTKPSVSEEALLSSLLTGESAHKVLGIRWNQIEDFGFFDPSPLIEMECNNKGPIT